VVKLGVGFKMKLKEFLEVLNKLSQDRPHLLEADVLIDTKARSFQYHLVEVVDIIAEDDDVMDAMGNNWITIYPDYNGSIL
jgi:hypothetical protein